MLAQRDDVVAVVEVRHRGPRSWETALQSVGQRKRERLRAAASRLWDLSLRKDPTVARVRFDVIIVAFPIDEAPLVEHFPAAF